MSDPAGEPGAPSGDVKVPAAADGSISKKAQAKAPGLTSIASTPDRVLLRLNKLLASPAGLSSFLSTANYTLYLLIYLESKSLPLQARLSALLSKTSLPAKLVATEVGPSKIAALAGLLSSTRTTLRLFGLLPLYAWMRQLMQGPKPGQDGVLYFTAVAQCTFYVLFQGLENIGLLTDSKVLGPGLAARIDGGSAQLGTTGKVYKYSYRAWLCGVLCDFVRLGREAQLERARRSARGEKSVQVAQEDEATDKKWWSEMVVPMSWTPVAAHFASQSGVPGFNLGWMGALGGLAGLKRTADLWDATK